MTERSGLPVSVAALCAAALLAPPEVLGDEHPPREIRFPDPPGMVLMVADLHTHSVFSDGKVWPSIRVMEANRDGLDALAITEHLEWQPHRQDIPHPDRNRAYEIASNSSGDDDLIVIAGAEITREMPAGHMNAVFIEDANALYRELPIPDELESERRARYDRLGDAGQYYARTGLWPARAAVEAANRQGAFVFWNHPDYIRQAPDGIARLSALHRELVADGLLHGIEIANTHTYSAEAFAIALEHDLTLIGVSDVHDLIEWDYPADAPAEGNRHRPVTLVLAEARTAAALREGLMARRTVVWYRNTLMGRADSIYPLLSASITVTPEATWYQDSKTLQITLRNKSDATFNLRHDGPHSFLNQTDRLQLPPHDAVEVVIKPATDNDELRLRYVIENALLAPGKPAAIEYTVARPISPE